MKTLVVYESLFGNTAKVAQAIASGLAERGSTRLATIGQVGAADLESFDLLVLGCPTQYHEATPDTLAWLDRIPSAVLADLPLAVFDTRYHTARLLSGSAAQAVGKDLKRRGGRLMAPPESFFVADREGPLEDGEIERAAAWARALSDALMLRSAA
jgi:flavodoxin I